MRRWLQAGGLTAAMLRVCGQAPWPKQVWACLLNECRAKTVCGSTPSAHHSSASNRPRQ